MGGREEGGRGMTMGRENKRDKNAKKERRDDMKRKCCTRHPRRIRS
jgi:hypothetical protein